MLLLIRVNSFVVDLYSNFRGEYIKSYISNDDIGDSTSSDTLPDLASPIPASPSPTTGLPVTSDILTSTDPVGLSNTTLLLIIIQE